MCTKFIASVDKIQATHGTTANMELIFLSITTIAVNK